MSQRSVGLPPSPESFSSPHQHIVIPEIYVYRSLHTARPALRRRRPRGSPRQNRDASLPGSPVSRLPPCSRRSRAGTSSTSRRGVRRGSGSSKALSRAEGISPCADALPRAMPCQRTAAGRCASAGAGRKWRESSNAARSPGGSREGDSPNSSRKAGGSRGRPPWTPPLGRGRARRRSRRVCAAGRYKSPARWRRPRPPGACLRSRGVPARRKRSRGTAPAGSVQGRALQRQNGLALRSRPHWSCRWNRRAFRRGAAGGPLPSGACVADPAWA